MTFRGENHFVFTNGILDSPINGWMDGITNAMDMSLGKIQEMVRGREAGVLQSVGSQRESHDWVTEQ